MKKLLYILSLVLFFTSCEDFLNVNPDNTGDLHDPESIRMLLVNGYPEYSYYYFTELLSDNLTDVGTNYPDDVLDPELTKKTYFWEPNQLEEYDFPVYYFYGCYSSIAYANYALEAIEKLENEGNYSKEETDPIKGEALLIRAYSHFMLVNIFAEHYDPASASGTLGIPYIAKAERNADATYRRNTIQEVYDLIDKDITDGFSLINDRIYNGKEKWHFNRSAAAAFASRFYLYRGLDSDWDKVIQYGRIVLGTDASSLLRDFAKFNDIPDYNQRKIEYSRSKYPTNLMISNVLSYGTAQMTYTRYTTTNDVLNRIVKNSSIYPTKAGGAGSRFLPGQGTLGYGVTFPVAFLPRYYQDFKLNNINSTTGRPYVTTVLFSVEEVLFNVAEAYVMKNSPQDYNNALELINQYLSTRLEEYNIIDDIVTDASVKSVYQSNAQVLAPHYSLTTDQNTYIKCLLALRRSEFLYLGLRWFDIKRMHLEITHKVVTDAGSGYDIVLSGDAPQRVMEFPASVTASGIEGNFNLGDLTRNSDNLENLSKDYQQYNNLKYNYPIKKN